MGKSDSFTIKRTDDKLKTLLLKISKKGYNKGLLMACNVFDKPDDY